MRNASIDALVQAINIAVATSGKARVDVGPLFYIGMNLEFEAPVTEGDIQVTFAENAKERMERFLDKGEESYDVAGFDYLVINDDPETLEKIQIPAPSQPIKFPTVVKFDKAFKALILAKAAAHSLLLNPAAPAAQRFNPTSSDAASAKKEWEGRMEPLIREALADIGIVAPGAIEDWGYELLDLLESAGLVWTAEEED